MKRILLSWSSGKDSAWSLHLLRQSAEYEVVGLLTTFNDEAGRVAMHAVRRELVERQAEAAGLPLWSIPLPWPCSNERYESLMAQACAKAIADGIEGIAFGTRAKLTCVDTEKLDRSFVGREFDEVLLSALPEEVDPCGERGEFHSFVYAGPMLNAVLPVSVGETVVRDQFVFADLISS